MLTVVTFGQSGQLARALRLTKPDNITLIQLNRQQADITKLYDIELAIAHYKPNVIINCAGFTNVELAESNAELAHALNAQAVKSLLCLAQKYSAKLIHISSDYVFDGNASTPYAIEAETNPLNIYGSSKLAGEQSLISADKNICCIRTSWLYHIDGNNFVNAILSKLLAGQTQQLNTPIQVVNDQYGSPTYAPELGHFIWHLIAYPSWDPIYHWSDLGICSWYEFAIEIQRQALAAGLITLPINIAGITSEQYPSIAQRPTFSALDTRHSQPIYQATHWSNQLKLFIQRKQKS